MAKYAIAFDLNTKAMKADGLTASDRTKIYQTEIPRALDACGFTVHPQGSVYHTDAEQDQIRCLMNLQTTLKSAAPGFCKYVRRANVFRMEDWSDITDLVSTSPTPLNSTTVTAEEELEEAEDFDDLFEEIKTGD